MMTAKMGERDSREEIQKAFKLFDDDNTGFITLKNLKRVAKELVRGGVLLCRSVHEVHNSPHGSLSERCMGAWDDGLLSSVIRART